MDYLDTSVENIKRATILLNKAVNICSATQAKDYKKPYYIRATNIIEDQKLWEFVTTHHSDRLAYVRLALKYDFSKQLFWVVEHLQNTQKDKQKTYRDIGDAWMLETTGFPNTSILLLLNWLNQNDPNKEKQQIENIRFNILLNTCQRTLGGEQSKKFIKEFRYDLLMDLLSPSVLDPFKLVALNMVISPRRDFEDIVNNCKTAIEKGGQINTFLIGNEEKTLFECPFFKNASVDQIQAFLEIGVTFRSAPLFVPTEAMIEAESNHQKILLNQAVGQSVKTSREKRKI